MGIDSQPKNMIRSISASWVFFLFVCSSLFPLIGTTCIGIQTAPDGDIPTWYQGDQWTYTIDPLYFASPNGTFNGAVHDFQETVLGIAGDAYEVNITGQITGTITMSGLQGTLSGEITGTSYLRVSDLAQETTILHSRGNIIVLFVPFPYQMDLAMNSTPPLELFDFPINTGEQWQISLS